MIKKYLVEPKSGFHQSLLLSFLEPGSFGFIIEGLDDKDKRNLFNTSKLKYKKEEIDITSVPSKVVIAYLEEDYSLKALVLFSSFNKNYYLFKVDHQNDHKLNIHQKYISNSLEALTNDYEKHLKNKGKSTFAGNGDFKEIENIDYFEYVYEKDIKKQIDKSSSIYKLFFNSNNKFTADFIYLVKNGLITIINKDKFDNKALTLDSMSKHKTNRKDCLLIDSNDKDIKYFIFTYKPHFINHYYLLKNLGNDTFEFIMESISFNKLFTSNELKDLKYKNGSAFAAKEFAKMEYRNFYLEYVAFEEEEEFEEEAIIKLEPIIDEAKVRRDLLMKEVMILFTQCKLKEDIGVSYHGQTRIKERIGDLSLNEMSALAKVTYEFGKNSVHFLEKDRDMFQFLQYQQNKKQGKTLRLFQDILFFFSMHVPHELITCFPYKENYDTYLKHKKEPTSKNTKKKKK